VTSFAYTWDANKRKLSQTETGIPLNNQTYSYDDEDRLASFSRNNGDNQAWNLSLVGDWNQFNNNGNVENRTHNAVHEITTVDATPLAHDVKGNLTQNKNGQVYAWDIENRLTIATDNQNNTLGTYTYDALGRRVSKTVGAITTVFVSDGMQEIAEYVNGTFSQSYVYGSYIDEPLLKIDNAGNKIYYHANNLFSIAALTDNNGAVVERYKYDPYGKATVLAADGITVRTQSLHGNPWLFSGYRLDKEIDIYHTHNRNYDFNFGRFYGRSPWGYIQERYSLYDYCDDNPICYVEPFSWGSSGFDEGMVQFGLGIVKKENEFTIWQRLGSSEETLEKQDDVMAHLDDAVKVINHHREIAQAVVNGEPSDEGLKENLTPGKAQEYLTGFKWSQYIMFAASVLDGYLVARYEYRHFDKPTSPMVQPLTSTPKPAPTTPKPKPVSGTPTPPTPKPTGHGNVQGGSTCADSALRNGEKWVGPEYKEIAPGVFRSKDGLRQFRMTDADITGKHGDCCHVHYESIGPDGRTITENSHVELKP
jgi:RHS repeat-associated protein